MGKVIVLDEQGVLWGVSVALALFGMILFDEGSSLVRPTHRLGQPTSLYYMLQQLVHVCLIIRKVYSESMSVQNLPSNFFFKFAFTFTLFWKKKKNNEMKIQSKPYGTILAFGFINACKSALFCQLSSQLANFFSVVTSVVYERDHPWKRNGDHQTTFFFPLAAGKDPREQIALYLPFWCPPFVEPISGWHEAHLKTRMILVPAPKETFEIAHAVSGGGTNLRGYTNGSSLFTFKSHVFTICFFFSSDVSFDDEEGIPREEAF